VFPSIKRENGTRHQKQLWEMEHLSSDMEHQEQQQQQQHQVQWRRDKV
jgi:hypothetical protein